VLHRLAIALDALELNPREIDAMIVQIFDTVGTAGCFPTIARAKLSVVLRAESAARTPLFFGHLEDMDFAAHVNHIVAAPALTARPRRSALSFRPYATARDFRASATSLWFAAEALRSPDSSSPLHTSANLHISQLGLAKPMSSDPSRTAFPGVESDSISLPH
jgi:hypothetical protein